MFKIALRNILRNRRRTLLTGLSITAAVMIVVYLWSFIMGIVDSSFENTIRSSSGHIRIMAPDYVRREKMLPLGENIADYTNIQKIAEKNPKVTLSTGRIKFGVLIEQKGKSKPVMGIGIDPAKEDMISDLKNRIIQGRKIIPGRGEMNMGDLLARDLGLTIGDTLTIVTQTAYGSLAAMDLRIVGIFRLNIPSFDGRTFYMPLDKAQTLLDMEGKVTEIFLLVRNENEAPKIAKEISLDLARSIPGKFTVKPWQDQGMIYFWMRIVKFIYGFIYMIILLLASFTILNTMFMSVLERTKEIGMMKALGMKNGGIVRMILYEAVLIGILASTVGAALGAGIAYYLSVVGIDFTGVFAKMGGTFNFPVSYVYRAVFKWTIILTGFVFGVFFSVLAAIPPAIKASEMEPIEALRTT